MTRTIGTIALFFLLMFTIAACDSGSNEEPSDGDLDTDQEDPADGDEDGDEDGDVLEDGDATEAEQEIEEEIDPGPGDFAINDILLTENTDCILSGTISFKTSVPTRAEVMIEGDGRSWSSGRSKELMKNHDMMVLGMYAETAYTITVKAYDGEGKWVLSDSQAFTTGALPDDFPPLETKTSEPASMQTGVTLFNIYRWNPGTDIQWAYLVGIDEAGKVVWYHKESNIVFSIQRLSNGNLQYNYANLGIKEIDMLGNTISDWTSIGKLDVEFIHHDVVEMPNGHFLTLSSNLKTIGGYPAEVDGDADDDGDNLQEYNVVGDMIVELDPDDDFTVVNSWKLFDYLDPMKTGEGFHDPFWDTNYFSKAPTKDWTHANALQYDAADNSFIVSLRHLDWLVKIDMDTDEQVWRFGPEGDFSLDPGEWQYHQHAPKMLESGNWLVYDNGNGRDSLAPGEIPFSRVVEYNIDEANKSAAQIWEYKGEERYYNQYVGDVSRMLNGNTLIIDGGLVADDSQSEYEIDNLKFARIVEITAEDPPRKVYEVLFKDDSAVDPIGYTIYRATRVDSLYP